MIEEIVEIMKRDGRVITHESINSWVMGCFGRDNYYWGKFGSLRQGDISLYFKHFHDKTPE